jgi:hypothetical protein
MAFFVGIFLMPFDAGLIDPSIRLKFSPDVAFGIFVTILIFIVIIYSIVALTKVKVLKKNVSLLFLAIGICLSITMYITIAYESFPKNNLSTMNNPSKDFAVQVSRDSTLRIPIRNVIDPVRSNLDVKIFHNVDGTNILPLQLSTTSDSPLSYSNDNFRNSTKHDTAGNKTQRVDNYNLPIFARHTGEVSNKSYVYTLDITYLNSTGARNNVAVPFSWAILTTDLSTLTYFWIVLIGVIVSRLLTLALNKLEEARTNQPKGRLSINFPTYSQKDYLWILFSFLIAVILFGSFRSQVDLTSNIIINISLAFGFGFSFDKVLEVAERFQKI